MQIISLGLVIVGLIVPYSRASTQQAPPSAAASFQQFRNSWREAWNRRDTKALGTLMSEDVDWIAADGTWLKGRKSWQEHHDRLFATQFKAAGWKVLDEQVQILDSLTAMTITATQIEGDTKPDGTAREVRQSVGSRVITRHSGRWLLRVAHNTIIQRAGSR
jgi:uncharacterized protein (TIGR02246 family)